jgi:hypothetical protein
MDLYRYDAGGGVFELPIMPYEAHMLSHIEPKRIEERGVLAVHKAGIVRSIPRRELLDKAGRLLAVLERDDEQIQYRYGIRVLSGLLAGSALGGGMGCTFRGEATIAEAGPGYCHIVGLHDMRDMQPVTLDDGTILKPERRRRPVELTQKIARLVAFLHRHDVATIACSVEENASRP